MAELLDPQSTSPSLGLHYADKKRGWWGTLEWQKIILAFVIVFFGIISAFGAAYLGISYVVPAAALAVGIPLLVYSCIELHVGVCFLFVISFFILGVMR